MTPKEEAIEKIVGYRWEPDEAFGEPGCLIRCPHGIIIQLIQGEPVDWRQATEAEKKLWEILTELLQSQTVTRDEVIEECAKLPREFIKNLEEGDDYPLGWNDACYEIERKLRTLKSKKE